MNNAKTAVFAINLCENCKYTKIIGDRCIKCKLDKVISCKFDMNLEFVSRLEKLQADLEKAEKVIEQIADLDACYRVNRKILNYFKEKEKNE